MKVKVISLPYIFQVLYVLRFTRPRYQVSVYRTIGPLVFKVPVKFLAHLSLRLIGERIVYSCSSVRPSYVVVVHNFKHLLLRNRLAYQSQILCEASLGRGNESLFAASGSHDQDGRHAHIWEKPFKNLLQNRQADFHKTRYVASGTPAHHSLFK